MNRFMHNPQHILIILCFVLLCLNADAQFDADPVVRTNVRIIDDNGKPIEGAAIAIRYIGVIPNTGESFERISDDNGRASGEFNLRGQVKIEARKKNYYPVNWPFFLVKGLWDGQKVASAEIIMREIKNPTGLYAKKVELGVPVFDQWLGFDFEVGDWIEPLGKGKVADIEFFPARQFEGYPAAAQRSFDHLSELHLKRPSLRGKYIENVSQFYGVEPKTISFEEAKKHNIGDWSGELKMRVPGNGGVHVEKESYQVFTAESLDVEYVGLDQWEMRMPHLAPGDGYQVGPLVWKRETTSPVPPDPKVGYFLKTRVKQDEQGNTLSANYAKIMTSDARHHGSDIDFDPRGKISFTYYFNPTPNDRNLEFDPEKNLFRDLKDSEEVQLP